MALSHIRPSAEGPLSLEMKTKHSQLCGFPAALGGRASPLPGGAREMRELSPQPPALGPSFVPPRPSASCCGPCSDLPVRATGACALAGAFPVEAGVVLTPLQAVLVNVQCVLPECCLGPSLGAGRAGLRRAGPYLCSTWLLLTLFLGLSNRPQAMTFPCHFWRPPAGSFLP